MPSVFVGMSGGIDSSVAAYLLKREGFDVVGITFTGVYEEGVKKCCSYEEVINAKKVCDFLSIPHKTINLKDLFESKIISYFIESYKAGLTPNPCILCNRFIKFGFLFDYSIAEGADFFATGHYARIVKKGKDFFIKRGIDEAKDQSYFISYIEKEKLPYIKLPLGNFYKSEVKKIAEEINLPLNPNKYESQDICFVPKDYREFLLKRKVEGVEGNFLYEGKIAGRHRGIPFYSFGQRRGLGISTGKRVFVRGFNIEKNEIILGEKPFSREFFVDNLNVFVENFEDGEYEVQFRYQSKPEKCSVNSLCYGIKITLNSPRELVTPGQFAVLYRENMVYLSGVIKEVKLT